MRLSLLFVVVAIGLSFVGCGGTTSTSVDSGVDTGALPVDSGVDAASVVDSGSDVDAFVADTGVDTGGNTDAGSRICGTRGAAPCMPNEFCNWPITAMCGRADAPGVCATRPDACAVGIAQVCGCDGTTYDTECDANAAGTAVDHVGPCIAP